MLKTSALQAAWILACRADVLKLRFELQTSIGENSTPLTLNPLLTRRVAQAC